MPVSLDHLAAALVGAGVLLVMLTLFRASESEGAAAASSYTLRRHVESFGDDLQTDLESLSTPVSLDAASGAFEFRARISAHDTTQYLVRYELETAGSLSGAPVYRLARFQDGVRTGGSADILRGWTAEAQTAAGAPATAPAEVAQVYVALDATAPFEMRGRAEPTARWETTVTPIILHYALF